MKTIVIVSAILMGIFFFFACSGGSSGEPVRTPLPGETFTPGVEIGLKRGNLAPNFEIKDTFQFDDFAGVENLSDLRGKVVVLNFWATWCGPCRIEMPSLEKLHNECKDEGLVLLAVNRKEQREKVIDFIEELEVTFGVMFDPKSVVAHMYQVTSIPHTYIIDKDGVIQEVVLGAINWNSDKVYQTVEPLLGKGCVP